MVGQRLEVDQSGDFFKINLLKIENLPTYEPKLIQMRGYDLPRSFRDVVGTLANEDGLVCAEHAAVGEEWCFRICGSREQGSYARSTIFEYCFLKLFK